MVVHGDPGPGNFLSEDGRIVALTDWEFVHHGDAAEDWPKILADPCNHLHLYGKAAARPGRKMGHVTRLTL